jgi:hypothetical protein
MRFSLRTLLLTFTVIAVAYFWAWMFLRNIYEKEIDLESYTQDLKSLQKQAAWMKFSRDTENKPFSLSVINENLADPDFYLMQQLRPRSSERGLLFRRDQWGRPFVAIALNEAGQPNSEILESKVIGYYSLGQDGKSETHGNDPDDLNSWRPNTDYYHEQAMREASDRARRDAVGIAAVPLAFVFGVILLYRDPHLARKEEPRLA